MIFNINIYISKVCIFSGASHAKTIRCTNAGSMLAHRLRRYANTEPKLNQRIAFAGM